MVYVFNAQQQQQYIYFALWFTSGFIIIHYIRFYNQILQLMISSKRREKYEGVNGVN